MAANPSPHPAPLSWRSVLWALCLLGTVLLLGSGCAVRAAGAPPARSSLSSSKALDPGVLRHFLEAQLVLRGAREHSSGERARAEVEAAARLLQRAVGRAPREALLWRYLAQAYAELPDPRKAVTAARRSLALDESDGYAHYLLGEQLSRIGALDEAEDVLLRARDLPIARNYEHLPHYHLYRLQKSRDRLDDALDALDAWKLALPEDGNPLVLKARLLWAHGRRTEAQDAARQALKEEPGDSDLLALLEQLYGNDTLGLEEALQQVASTDWSVAGLHRSLIAVNNRIGRYDRSLEHLKILAILEGMDDRRLRTHQARLYLAMSQGDDAEARLQTLETAEGEGIGEVELLLLRSLLQQERAEEATALLDGQPLDEFGRLAGEEALVQFLLDQGKLDEAWGRLQPYAEVGAVADLAQFPLLSLAQRVAMRRGELTTAQSLFERIAAIDGALSIWDEVRLLEAQGRVDAALVRIRTAFGGAPFPLDAVPGLLQLLTNAERFGEAHALVDRAVQENEESRKIAAAGAPGADRSDRLQALADQRLRLFSWRSGLERLQHDGAACERTLRAALDLAPEDADSLNALAYLFAEEGRRLEEGLELARRALDQRPYSGAILDTQGWLLFRVGRGEEALEVLERANGLLPYEPEVLDHLGDVLWALERRDEAIARYEAALRAAEPQDLDYCMLKYKYFMHYCTLKYKYFWTIWLVLTCGKPAANLPAAPPRFCCRRQRGGQLPPGRDLPAPGYPHGHPGPRSRDLLRPAAASHE